VSGAGGLITRRTLEVLDAERYVPGQLDVRIIDPRPHRDRADLAAIVTYVDDDGLAVSATCMRYRDERGWKSITVKRASRRKLERTHTAAALGYELAGEHLQAVERAAVEVVPFPFEEPSEEEQSMRRLAHRLMDHVERKGSPAEDAGV
jgi:hypothetical protein